MDFQMMNRLLRCNREFSHRKIRMQELSDTEYMICSYVCTHADCSQEDAAEALKIDKTTLAKALTGLEADGCIARAQDTRDRRVKRLGITEKGREKISGLMDIHDEWLKNIMSCLSPQEQAQFEDYCVRLLDAAESLLKKNKTEENENARQ